MLNTSQINEYLSLREEIQSNLSAQRTLSSFSITFVITVIGLVSQTNKKIPELYLLPIIVCLLSSVKAHNYKQSISRIAGYMIVRHENISEFYWETCLNKYRKEYQDKNKFVEFNNCKSNNSSFNKSKNHSLVYSCFKDFLIRLLKALETQEYTLMEIICFILYILAKFKIIITAGFSCTIYGLKFPIIPCILLSLLSIILTIFSSHDYWNMNSHQINEYKDIWKKIIEQNPD